eukprot:SAG31_NODE_15882_length_733_cov_1.917067_1_plen_58_part_00
MYRRAMAKENNGDFIEALDDVKAAKALSDVTDKSMSTAYKRVCETQGLLTLLDHILR